MNKEETIRLSAPLRRSEELAPFMETTGIRRQILPISQSLASLPPPTPYPYIGLPPPAQTRKSLGVSCYLEKSTV